ncbi:MAG: FtsW/RodA/SpoVE family cell cycle protein, partial [Planctomycetota bacterium]
MSLGELVHRGESGLAETLVRGSASKKEISIPAFKLLTPAWLCVGSGLLLSLLGVLAIDLGTDSPAGGLSALAWRQAVFCVVGLLAALVVALPHFRMLSVLAWPAYIASLALLVFLLLPFVPASIVTPRNGTRGWIDLGPVDFQPSE